MTDREHIREMAKAYADAAYDAVGIALALGVVYAALWIVWGGG